MPRGFAEAWIDGPPMPIFPRCHRVAIYRLWLKLLHCACGRGLLEDDHGKARAGDCSFGAAAVPQPRVTRFIGRGCGGYWSVGAVVRDGKRGSIAWGCEG